MASISSAGIGSGLDVNSIVTQLVALEKQPLKTLELKAKTVTAQVSALGELQSQFSSLTDVATRISSASAWTARSSSSSNTSAATISVTAAASATSFSLDVDALAQKQSIASGTVTAGAPVGGGTMTFRVGKWTGASADAGADNVAAAAARATATSTAAAAAAAVAADASASADLTAFAVGTPVAAAYASAYADWAAAVAANDHATPALQAAEDAALLARDSAYADLGVADAPAQAAADALTATAAATDASALKGVAVAAAAAATAAAPTFTAAAGSSDVSITVTAVDTVATLAAKINAANAGVVATAFNDGTQDRLLLSSKDTGAAAGFRVQVADSDLNNTDSLGLSRFVYDPQSSAAGMASGSASATYGKDARARINGLAVTSKNNTLAGNIPGVTIELKTVTTTGYGTPGEVKSPVTMNISEDVTPAVKNIQDFVTAYNTLNKSLTELTKYDEKTKTASLFQADSAVLSLQSVLRNMLGSSSTGSVYQRLSDVGVERQLDGSLSINTNKLSTAANNGAELQKLFVTDNKNAATNGFALKFAELGKGLLAAGGGVSNKAQALQSALLRNQKEQNKVNEHAAVVEARLRKAYTALDTKMASLTALNQYVAQQVTTWNKSTG